MYRNIINDLMHWYENDKEKTLLLNGAKGVGKTWIATDFANAFFEDVFMVNFEEEMKLKNLFQAGTSIDPEKIEKKLTFYFDKQILPQKTLLVFDEVQLAHKGLEGIMTFAKAREDYIVCIITSGVGNLPKQEEYSDDLHCLTLMPMTFEEFLTANKAQDLCKYIEQQKLQVATPDVIEKMLYYLHVFYMIGGMPLIVADYMKHKDFDRIDKLQNNLLLAYRAYIQTYAPKGLVDKILKIWDSIPNQMKKDNRKFMYGYVDPKARAREYGSSVKWLINTGLVRQVMRIRHGVTPLDTQVDSKSFELYHLDHGLLRAMCGYSHRDIGTDENMFEDINGALIEQFVLEELTLNKTVKKLYFWISGATAKVDFVFEDDGEVIPVDVQSKVRRKAQSIKVFRERYDNRMAIRISLGELNFTKGILNIPLYGLWNF